MQKTETLLITPDTKLAELLNNYPQLEDCLVQMSPAYAKLKNPLLRKTIGKVATMRQIAEIGKIPLGELINKLRSTIGQDNLESESTNNSHVQEFDVDEKAVTHSLDARPLLEEGIHPLGQVLQEVPQLKPGELYELITPFTPIPLIEKVREKGFSSHTIEKSPNEFRTYFQKS